MHWDRVFEDLEGQLAAEWEAERAVLDAESERLRIAKLSLRTRLRVLEQRDSIVVLRLSDGERRAVTLRAIGADWIATESTDANGTLIVPLTAVTSLETDHGSLLATLDYATLLPDTLRERMTLGFLFRDLARRRLALRVALRDGEILHGTVDRAGADHLDLAVHDAGDARRAAAVRAFRMVPFDALVWAHPRDAVI
ncbi:hypothetical protein DC31_09825 [Microbacterium sp. CH12i]|uniref:hypothetical protein n=1 Tax=Microbacterium sp. CH12i TaxID=1479651 RepID=UPI000460B750|nr:hypothetical protein [Microbacterium sp. CH12i]KDA06649.1 hypothetical protein DC31_09825 [Microbacterium sp. CH12i]